MGPPPAPATPARSESTPPPPDGPPTLLSDESPLAPPADDDADLADLDRHSWAALGIEGSFSSQSSPREFELAGGGGLAFATFRFSPHVLGTAKGGWESRWGGRESRSGALFAVAGEYLGEDRWRGQVENHATAQDKTTGELTWTREKSSRTWRIALSRELILDTYSSFMSARKQILLLSLAGQTDRLTYEIAPSAGYVSVRDFRQNGFKAFDGRIGIRFGTERAWSMVAALKARAQDFDATETGRYFSPTLFLSQALLIRFAVSKAADGTEFNWELGPAYQLIRLAGKSSSQVGGRVAVNLNRKLDVDHRLLLVIEAERVGDFLTRTSASASLAREF